MRTPRFLVLMATVAACLYPGASIARQATPLSLDDCIRMALEAPSAVTRAQLDLGIAERERRVARSGFLPQASLGSEYAYNSPSKADRSAPSFIPLNAIREFSALVSIVQDVDTSGRLRADSQRARADLDIAGANRAMAERDLKRSVSAAYYRVLLARKLIGVFEGRVSEAVEFERRTTMLADAGEAARADVVKATSQTAQFRQALSAATTAAELANQELASFWTEDVSQPLNLVDVLDQAVPEPLVQAQTQPYLARQEYRLFDAQTLGLAADARRARSALRPELQLAFQWGLDQEIPGLSFNDRGYAAFATLRFNLFDGSRARNQVRQAETRAGQVEQQRQIANREFSREYQAALSRVRGIYEQISLARVRATAAEEDLRLSRVRYEGGEGPALEVVTAQANLADARSSYYEAIADYLIAWRDLEVASGQ